MSTWIILNAIGHDATLRLQRALGGGYVPLRATLDDSDPLVVVLGRETALKLWTKLRDEPEASARRKLYVGRGLVRAERNRDIVAMRRAGWHVNDIATKYHMTQEAVRAVMYTYADEIDAPEAQP